MVHDSVLVVAILRALTVFALLTVSLKYKRMMLKHMSLSNDLYLTEYARDREGEIAEPHRQWQSLLNTGQLQLLLVSIAFFREGLWEMHFLNRSALCRYSNSLCIRRTVRSKWLKSIRARIQIGWQHVTSRLTFSHAFFPLLLCRQYYSIMVTLRWCCAHSLQSAKVDSISSLVNKYVKL